MAKTRDGTYDPDEILGPENHDHSRKEELVRKSFWSTVKKALKAIPFMEDVVAAYYCALDPNTPFRVRATLIGALAYFVMPLDVIPDFILALGFTDDAALLATIIGMFRTHIKPEHREAAARAFDDEKTGAA